MSLDLISIQFKWLRLALSNAPYWIGAFVSLHLRAKMDLVSEKLRFFKWWQNAETQCYRGKSLNTAFLQH
jgi:hypothetical protein